MNRRPLVIGQAPGRLTNGYDPFGPHTPTGRRLAALFDSIGLDGRTATVLFDRLNLIPDYRGRGSRGDRFPMREARLVAGAVRPLFYGRSVIALGRGVATACGFRELAPLEWWRQVEHGRSFDFAVVPHPSGRNRWYNSPVNFAAAREFWSGVFWRDNASRQL